MTRALLIVLSKATVSLVMPMILKLTASTQTALHWAPLKSSVQRASSSKFTSLLQRCKIQAVTAPHKHTMTSQETENKNKVCNAMNLHFLAL